MGGEVKDQLLEVSSGTSTEETATQWNGDRKAHLKPTIEQASAQALYCSPSFYGLSKEESNIL